MEMETATVIERHLTRTPLIQSPGPDESPVITRGVPLLPLEREWKTGPN